MKEELMITDLDRFVTTCVEEFGDNLTGLLYYGSASRKESNPFSDQDLLLTARNYDLNLMVGLHRILRQVTFLIDLPVVFESEIPVNPDHFRLVNHGCYFLEILKLGEPLHGRNIFLDIPLPSESAIKQSLFDTITEYTQFFRRKFIESNRERTMSDNYQLNRRLVKALHDLLWLMGTRCEHDASLLIRFKRDMPGFFTPQEENLLSRLVTSEQAKPLSANLSDDLALTRFSMMEKVYKSAQQIIDPSLQTQ